MNVGKFHLPKLGYTTSIQCRSSIQPAASICVVPHPSTKKTTTHKEAAGGEAGEDWVRRLPRCYSIVQQCGTTLHPSNEIVKQARKTGNTLLLPKGILLLGSDCYKSQDFSGSTVEKNPLANAGDIGLIPELGSRKWQPTPVFLPGQFHGQRSLVSYSPGGRKELDMTEHTHTLQSINHGNVENNRSIS